jgi:hypothetical protein
MNRQSRLPGNALPCYLTRPAFLASLAFLAGVRFVFGCGASGTGAFFSDAVVVFIRFLLDRAAVVTLITPIGRNIKAIQRRRAPPQRASEQWRVHVLFLCTRQNQRLSNIVARTSESAQCT